MSASIRTASPVLLEQRLPWVDTLKGLGILLVVFGHETGAGLAQAFVYLFHMPLFFALSGLLHKPHPDRAGFLRKRAIHLLVPYAAFTTIAACVKLLLSTRHGLTTTQVKHGLFIVLWGGAAMKGIFGALWFLTCLFLTQQVMNYLLVRAGLQTTCALTAVAWVLSYLNSIWMPGLSLPWDAQVVLAAMPYFLAGYLARGRDILGWQTSLIGIIAVAVSLYYLRSSPETAYDMRAGYYGLPVITAVLAFGCILACVRLSVWLTPILFLGKWLQQLGAFSLGIMLIHKALPVLPVFRPVLAHGTLLTFVTVVILSWCISGCLWTCSFTRAVLLGSERDFQHIFVRNAKPDVNAVI